MRWGCCCRADSVSTSSRSRVRPDGRSDLNWRGEKRSSKFTWRQKNQQTGENEHRKSGNTAGSEDINQEKKIKRSYFRKLQVCMLSTSSCALHVHCSGGWGVERQSKPFLWRRRATSCDGLPASCLPNREKRAHFFSVLPACLSVKKNNQQTNGVKKKKKSSKKSEMCLFFVLFCLCLP